MANDPSLSLSPRQKVAAMLALGVSFLVVGGLGSAGFCSIAKASVGAPSKLCFLLAGLYPAIMLVVHVVGYRIWQRQFCPRVALGGPAGFTAIAALAVSFLLIGGLGSVGLYWGLRELPGCSARIALGRTIVFAVAMLLIHLAGYRLWKLQFTSNKLESVLAVYSRPIKTALLQQVGCIILAALVLDMGETLNATIIAALSYWMSAGLIMARRLDKPSRGDLLFIRWAFLAIWLAAMIIGPLVWHRMKY